MSLETEAALVERQILEGSFPERPHLKKFIPSRLLLQWQVTELCNLKCRHCYQDTSELEPELSYEEMLEILDQYVRLLREWGIGGHINFSGGEPLIKKWFPDLLEKVAGYQDICSYGILSNGTLLDDGTARELKKLSCRFVQISIDGPNQVHDRLRGAGSFQKAAEALQILKRRRIPSLVSFTVHRSNADLFAGVAKAGRELKADVIWSDRLIPLGRGRELRDQIMAPLEVAAYFKEMDRLRKELSKKWFNPTKIRMHRALQFLTLLKNGEKNATPYMCNAGRSLLTVMPSGLVVPCRRMPVIVGDLKKRYLGDIYQQSLLLKKLRSPRTVPDDCENCRFTTQCRGGLRCLSYAYYGNPFKTDPQCFQVYKELPRMEGT